MKKEDTELCRVVVLDGDGTHWLPHTDWQLDSDELHELVEKLRAEGRTAYVVAQESAAIDARPAITWNWYWDSEALKITEAALRQSLHRRPIVEVNPERLYSLDEASRLIARSICPPTAAPTDERGTPIGGTSTPFESNRVSCLLDFYALIRDRVIVPRHIISRAPEANPPEVWTRDDDQRYGVTSDQIAMLCERRFITTKLLAVVTSREPEVGEHADETAATSGTWEEIARRIADAFFEDDRAKGATMAGLKGYSERVAEELNRLGVTGRRGKPVTAGTVQREALQADKWRPPGKKGK